MTTQAGWCTDINTVEGGGGRGGHGMSKKEGFSLGFPEPNHRIPNPRSARVQGRPTRDLGTRGPICIRRLVTHRVEWLEAEQEPRRFSRSLTRMGKMPIPQKPRWCTGHDQDFLEPLGTGNKHRRSRCGGGQDSTARLIGYRGQPAAPNRRRVCEGLDGDECPQTLRRTGLYVYAEPHVTLEHLSDD